MALLRYKYEGLLTQPWSGKGAVEVRQRLNHLRRLVLLDGLPALTEEEKTNPSLCSLRGRLWKLLLTVREISASEYTALVSLGPSHVNQKILNDAFRTFASDKMFTARVSEAQMVRVLNALATQSKGASLASLTCAWAHAVRAVLQIDAPDRLPGLTVSYVQGMNVLLAPILYVMPELDAFYTFEHLVRQMCPMYVQPNLDGVHYGLQLLDECLQVVDPELFAHLRKHKADPKVYAFASILTLCGCTPPLEEVLKLWDYLFAFGVHLAVLCTISQYILVRDQILASSNPMKVLRALPDLQAQPVIALSVRLVKQLPDELYGRLMRHPYDHTLYPSWRP